MTRGRSPTRVNDPDQISSLCDVKPNIIWVDVADPTSQDFDELAKELIFTRSPSKTAATNINGPRSKNIRATTLSCFMKRNSLTGGIWNCAS